MTVKELMDDLKEMAEDALVVISGYEGGLDEVNEIRVVSLKLNVNTDLHLGSHEEDPLNGTVEGVLLGI